MSIPTTLFFLFFPYVAAQDFSLCFPPPTSLTTIDSRCAQGVNVENPNYNCQGAYFVRSSGSYFPCSQNSECRDQTVPNEWCSPTSDPRYQAPCTCDLKLRACTTQRSVPTINNELEYQWSYCTDRNEQRCGRPGFCSP